MELLLAHGANIEHKDKKGCTSLILAASAGHAVTVAILLDHNANIEAQSDRTKDTALSLACSGGRQEVHVDLCTAPFMSGRTKVDSNSTHKMSG